MLRGVILIAPIISFFLTIIVALSYNLFWFLTLRVKIVYVRLDSTNDICVSTFNVCSRLILKNT